jgi:hypothetical protein
VPLFSSLAQLGEAGTVNEVMDAMAIPTDLRQQFVARQATLVRMRAAVSAEAESPNKVSPID